LENAYQNSNFLVRAFTEIVAVQGTAIGIVMSTLVAFFTVLLFTGNFRISILAIITISSIVITMFAFFKLMNWNFGIIEAVSVTILVGFSVDYCLHIAESYSISLTGPTMTREERIRLALTRIGVSIFYSSITTFGAAVMIFFCTIMIFVRFGIIIAVNTAFSIIFSLFLFSALLAVMGPKGKTGTLKGFIIALSFCIWVISTIYLVLKLGQYDIPGFGKL